MEWATRQGGLPPVRISPCRFLLAGRCSIYSMRPAICRLFGAVDHPMLRCPHGCRPEKYLTDAESRAILKDIEDCCATGREEK
jgi:Fe-S-cluster containining protein